MSPLQFMVYKVSHFIKRHYWWLLPLLVADILFFRWLYMRDQVRSDSEGTAPLSVQEQQPVEIGRLYGYPTSQIDLALTNDASVYMPTASGRVGSALYGSVRTVQRGGRLQASFHEGIDIAPMSRGRGGRPRDMVAAVADGQVVYVNRAGGNSSYGIYIVVTHSDRLGDIYTLYSHLADVGSDIRVGKAVRRGHPLGRMGNTASTGIPMARAHLHFEIGVIVNRQFEAWVESRFDRLDHGIWHGWNLTGIDPLDVYGGGEAEPRFCMADYLKQLSPAFVLVFASDQQPDYYVRYPLLWQGVANPRGAIHMAVSEGGVPLNARPATDAERSLLTPGRPVTVVDADPAILGRNGLRLVEPHGDTWRLGSAGERWLEILTW